MFLIYNVEQCSCAGHQPQFIPITAAVMAIIWKAAIKEI
jgi:hypothetical protein